MASLKILIIASGLPYPVDHGRRLRMFHLYSPLAGQYETHWVCSDEHAAEADIQAAQLLFQKVSIIGSSRPGSRQEKFNQRYNPYPKDRMLQEYISRISQSEEFDLVIVDGEAMAPYVSDCRTNKPRLLNTHNIPSLVEARSIKAAPNLRTRLFYSRRFLAAKYIERHYFPEFDAITAVSLKETEIIKKKYAHVKTFYIPNGIDLERITQYQNVKSAASEKVIAFLGPLRYHPNDDAVHYFCSSIFPLVIQKDNTVKLKLVGKGTEDFGHTFYPHLPVTGLGYVDDPFQHLSTARLSIAPFRIGGGTRIKILESLALGIPVVATSIGAEGIDIGEEGGLFRADAVERFAQYVIDLLQCTPQERAQLCSNGQKTILDHYTWKQVSAELDKVIRLFAK
jgi:polysaccharide biosynthesis protein PslH